MRIEKIRLDEVKKAYGDIKALEDISLSLYQGELLCVAGLSGSGKSVLADIISGRMPKDGGGCMWTADRLRLHPSVRPRLPESSACGIRHRSSVIFLWRKTCV